MQTVLGRFAGTKRPGDSPGNTAPGIPENVGGGA